MNFVHGDCHPTDRSAADNERVSSLARPHDEDIVGLVSADVDNGGHAANRSRKC